MANQAEPTLPTAPEMTPEDIQRAYSACLDSVGLLNAGKPEGMEVEQWAKIVEANTGHLKLMLTKEFWTSEYDLAPLEAASQITA